MSYVNTCTTRRYICAQPKIRALDKAAFRLPPPASIRPAATRLEAEPKVVPAGRRASVKRAEPQRATIRAPREHRGLPSELGRLDAPAALLLRALVLLDDGFRDDEVVLTLVELEHLSGTSEPIMISTTLIGVFHAFQSLCTSLRSTEVTRSVSRCGSATNALEERSNSLQNQETSSASERTFKK